MNPKIMEVLGTLANVKPLQIPPYSQGLTTILKDDIKKLMEQLKQHQQRQKRQDFSQLSNQQQGYHKARLALCLDQIYRIKRFFLIYYNNRCNRIEDQFWHFGGDLNNLQKNNLSEAEKVYYGQYKNLVMDYIDEIGVDLTIDLQPPIDLDVEVRVLQDCEQILDEHGHVVKLQKNSGGLMKKKLIEAHKKQGYVTILKK